MHNRAFLSSLLRDLRNGLADSVVGSATADIPAKPAPDVFGRGVRGAVEKRFASQHKSRSAKTALRRIVLDEGLLNRMQLALLRQRFNGHNGLSQGVNREYRAGIDQFVVQQDSTRSAFAAIANSFGASDGEVITKGVQQSDSRLKICVIRLAIDGELHRDLAGPMHRNLLPGGKNYFWTGDQRDRGGDSGDSKKIPPRNAGIVVRVFDILLFWITHEGTPGARRLCGSMTRESAWRSCAARPRSRASHTCIALTQTANAKGVENCREKLYAVLAAAEKRSKNTDALWSLPGVAPSKIKLKPRRSSAINVLKSLRVPCSRRQIRGRLYKV